MKRKSSFLTMRDGGKLWAWIAFGIAQWVIIGIGFAAGCIWAWSTRGGVM